MPTPAQMPARSALRPVPLPEVAGAAAPVAEERRPNRALDRYQRAVRASTDLTPASRLVALTLASLARRRTSLIPGPEQPTVAQLCEMTGLRHDQLMTAVRYLQTHGWLHERTPTDMRWRLGRP